MTMVGRKKRSTANRNHYIANNVNNDSRQDMIGHEHQTKYNAANHSRRYVPRVRNTGSDNEVPAQTTFVRRRPFNVVASGDYRKRQPPLVEDGILPRSDSREGGSASAGSVASAADDEGSPSASGVEGEPDSFDGNPLPQTEYVGKRSNNSQEEIVADKLDNHAVADCPLFDTSSTQTECSPACTDVIFALSQLKPWERAETLAQLVYSLSALEQRFLGSCVEAAVRSNSVHLRQYETLYNDPQAIANCLSMDYHRLFDVAYATVCMLRAGSRQAAALFLEVLNRLFNGWPSETAQWSYEEKESALLKLKSTVSAALNHPAVAIESKAKLLEIHDYLCNLHTFPVTTLSDCPNQSPLCTNETVQDRCSDDKKKSSAVQSCPPSTSRIVIPSVISSLDVVKVIQGQASEEYAIEVSWSDGTKDYVVKTGGQIFDLQQRLLNEFPDEAGCSTSKCGRLIPYLRNTAPESVTGYIRSLPNLPARVLVSPVIYDAFCSKPLNNEARDDTPSPPRYQGSSASSVAGRSKENNAAAESLEIVTSGLPQLCLVSNPSNPFAPAVALCSPGNPIVTSSGSCISVPGAPLASPGVAQYISLVPRTMNLRNVAPVLPRPIYTLQPHQSVQKPCQNCGGPHPFALCGQSTILDAVNSGTYNLNYGASDEPKARPHGNRNHMMPMQVSPSMRLPDVVSASSTAVINCNSVCSPERQNTTANNSVNSLANSTVKEKSDSIVNAAAASRKNSPIQVAVSNRNS